MIITKLQGGHSNQLFQYAIGRALAYKHGVPLKLDISWFDTQPKETPFPRRYEIDSYSLVSEVATQADLRKVGPPVTKPSLIERVLKKARLTPRFTIMNEQGLGFNSKVTSSPDNSYLSGYWQNENYFSSIRSELLDELEPTTPLTSANKKYLQQIQSAESVSLHVRREDYVGVQEFNDFHGLTPLEYYAAAYKKICQTRKKKLPIFVFSTDIAWCKENLRFDAPITFVEGNSSGSDDMRLMKHCSHNIMANSSFSWWGAWLNTNPDKIVIAPKVWFKDQKSNSEMELPKEWVRL